MGICDFFAGAFITLKAAAQIPPFGKYDTTNYAKDRKMINSITNIFDKSLSLNGNTVTIGADGKISYGNEAELQSFIDDRISYKSVITVPGTELLRIFNYTTAIKTKVADAIFSSPQGYVHFKVTRAETFIKQKGKWYLMMGQGTNVMSQQEFNIYRNLHTIKN